MKLHQSLRTFSIVLFAVCTAICTGAFAQDGDPNGLVEVQVPQDHLAPYLERRNPNGMYIGFVYENFVPSKYTSILDSKTYSEMYGSESVPLIGLAIDYKRNFSLGSIALGLSGGMGNLSDSRSGEDRSLDLMKYAANLKFNLDALMPEPYVVPYVGVSMYQISVKDKGPTDSKSKTTPMGYAYTVGCLLQLDWLDYETAKSSTFSVGLENTFIDVFMTQYAKSGGDTDPDMETDMIWGAGLKVEF